MVVVGGASTMPTASRRRARLSPGATRRMSPQRMSFGSPNRRNTLLPSHVELASVFTLPRGGGNPRSPSFGARSPVYLHGQVRLQLAWRHRPVSQIEPYGPTTELSKWGLIQNISHRFRMSKLVARLVWPIG